MGFAPEWLIWASYVTPAPDGPQAPSRQCPSRDDGNRPPVTPGDGRQNEPVRADGRAAAGRWRRCPPRVNGTGPRAPPGAAPQNEPVRADGRAAAGRWRGLGAVSAIGIEPWRIWPAPPRATLPARQRLHGNPASPALDYGDPRAWPRCWNGHESPVPEVKVGVVPSRPRIR